MLLMTVMKRVSLKQAQAPAPRYTLWVPGIIAVGLCLVWLGLVFVFQR